MKDGKLLKAVNTSIEYGIENGRIDADRDAASIEMVRHMARILDSDGGDSSIMRYVSPASFFNYCEKLGFIPTQKDDTVTKAGKNIINLVGNSKWKKQA